jgi:CRISPR-associated protein Cas5d
MSEAVVVKVWGEFALFTRPELKVERLSYVIMTPSSARGILDSILYRPQMRWQIRKIIALEPTFPSEFPEAERGRPYRMLGVRRNEIQGKIAPRTIEAWIREPSSCVPYLVDSAGREGAQGQNRTQRNSLILHHVAYLIEATPRLTERANLPRLQPADDEEGPAPDSIAKYVAMFQRRVRKGQCFQRPYLGCREFACQFAPPNGSEQRLSSWNERLGMMLYDLRYSSRGPARPGFFEAEIQGGVLHCDTLSQGPGGSPPVKVFGWEEAGES